MKETGMVRRIDELGRVVIPKEIRRTMRLREGEEMEVFVTDVGEVVLKKYSPMQSIVKIADEYRRIISRAVGEDVLVTDKDVVVASAAKNEIGKKISKRLEGIINARKTFADGTVTSVTDEQPRAKDMVVVPIVSRGDALGALVLRSDLRRITDAEKKLAETASELLTLSIG